MTTDKKQSVVGKLIPVMLAFFVMGFVDMVGIATNYVKADFDLSDAVANLLPSMVFIWFLVLSVPTSLLMNRIGRRKTVVLSIAITAVALILPYLAYNLPMMMISFCLLGIGNTLLQVSLNPLVSNIVSDKALASTMTFGQCVKAVASFIAPILAGWLSLKLGNWELLYPIFAGVSVIAVIAMWFTRIEEEKEPGKGSSFADCFRLLGIPVILLSFIGIVCHVGIDVGVNTTVPRIMQERLGMSLENAGFAASLYFAFRLGGSLIGTFTLSRVSNKGFFAVSVLMLALGVAGLFFAQSMTMIYTCIALVGLGNSNVFSIIIAKAMLAQPDRKNEISGLMIMGLIGGAIFPPLMGLLTDLMGSQNGALIMVAAGVAYLAFLAAKMKK